MYWSFQGYKIDERSMSDNINYKLGSFLILQPDFFYFTMDVLITCKKRTGNNRIYDFNRIEQRLRALAMTDNSISNADYYLKLLQEYNDEKINKGKLLDYIVYKIGPYKLSSEGVNRLSDCKIVIDEKLCSDMNFDVAFYTFTKHQNLHGDNVLDAEVIECKIDINTFVHSPPMKKDSFSDDAKKKLELIKYINQRKRNYDSISFYFATCRRNVESCRQVLKANGYDFVQILACDDLYEMLKRFRVKLPHKQVEDLTSLEQS